MTSGLGATEKECESYSGFRESHHGVPSVSAIQVESEKLWHNVLKVGSKENRPRHPGDKEMIQIHVPEGKPDG